MLIAKLRKQMTVLIELLIIRKKKVLWMLFLWGVENQQWVDANLSQADSSLQAEINICVQKITQLQNELNAAEREIRRLRRLLNSLK